MGYEGTQADFTEAFLKDQVIYAPFNEHVLDFWNMREHPNILFLHYEDMKSDMSQVVRKTMKFLGKNFSEEEISRLCTHLSVDSMRKNPMCNNEGLVGLAKSLNSNGKTSGHFSFIRKGEVGSFREEFSNDVDEKFENFMHQPTLKHRHFEFKLR